MTPTLIPSRPRRFVLTGTATLLLALPALPAFAAASAGCEGGGFTVLGRSGVVDVEIPAANVPATITVRGRYVQFDIDAVTFGIRNFVFRATTNPLDMTNGVDTPVFAGK